MIANPFPYIFAVLGIYLPAFLGVIACDAIINKSDNWYHMIWPEGLIFGFAFAFSFVSTPIELALLGTMAIPTSLVGALTINYGFWVKKNDAEYCGKERLHFYSMLSFLAGLILLAIRLFWGIPI